MKPIYHKLYLFILGAFTLLASGCKDELARININPNEVEDPGPAYLLTAAIKNASDTYWNIGDRGANNPAGLFVQYWASLHYTDIDRYIVSNGTFQGFWDKLYTKSIINLDKVISLSREEGNPNYEAAALVIRSWDYCLLTDVYGDVPYSESIDIEGIATPKYDAQEDVYQGILEDLKAAVALFDPHQGALEGDLLYDGDTDLWKKFANSLRLRIALRISKRDPEAARAAIQEVASEGGKYIEGNDEIAQVVYQDAPNDNPSAELFLTRDDFRISAAIVDKLLALHDPRLPVYADPTQDETPEIYVGMPNGLLDGDASTRGASRTSKPGKYFLAPTAPAVIISYAEVLFDRAEAAARGFTNDDPETLYREAIRASLDQYVIPENDQNQYLSQAEVQYDPGDFENAIGTQKWIALFGQGSEAFAEWRRLGYPKLKPAVAGSLEGAFPQRYIYPGTEQSLNGENYKNAVAHQGPDLLTTALWFNKN